MDAGEARAGNARTSVFGHDDVASILAAGVLRLRARRNLTGTKRGLVSSPETDLISIPERSVHDRRKNH